MKQIRNYIVLHTDSGKDDMKKTDKCKFLHKHQLHLK